MADRQPRTGIEHEPPAGDADAELNREPRADVVAMEPRRPWLRRLGGRILLDDPTWSLPPEQLRDWARLGVAGVVALLHVPLLFWLRDIWATEELADTMLSLATPFVVAGLFYLRRHELGAVLRAEPERPEPLGLALIALSAAIAVTAISLEQWIPLAISAPLGVHGFLLWTRRAARTGSLLTPLYMLVFVVPGTHGKLGQFSEWLQIASAEAARILLNILGFPTARHGVVLATESSLNIVSEACSGMTTLTALLLFTLVLAFLTRLNGWQTGASLVALLPIALGANGGRVALITWLNWAHGYDVAMGPLHDVSAYVVFGLAYATLFAFMRTLRLATSSPNAHPAR